MRRCEGCGLTVMACPDLRWVRYYGVYPLWMTRSLADRIMASPAETAGWWDEADGAGRLWAAHLRGLGL